MWWARQGNTLAIVQYGKGKSILGEEKEAPWPGKLAASYSNSIACPQKENKAVQSLGNKL